MVAEAGLRGDIGELPAGHAGIAAARELSDDGKPGVVAERGQHSCECDLVGVWMRQGHGLTIGRDGNEFNLPDCRRPAAGALRHGFVRCNDCNSGEIVV